MQIVAIGYKKGRGKDSLANFIKDHLSIHCKGCVVKKVGFADKLKDLCFQLYGWAGLQRGVYYETHYEEKEIILPAIGMSPRQIWITVGNALREVYGYTWIHYVTKMPQNVDVLLVKDLGFWNEAEEVRTGDDNILVKMEREGPMASDGRETELDKWSDWDSIAGNNGSLIDLQRIAVTICEHHILPVQIK
jgi:hypothetical protein